MAEGGSLVTPGQAVRDWLRKMGEVAMETWADQVTDSARLAHPAPSGLLLDGGLDLV